MTTSAPSRPPPEQPEAPTGRSWRIAAAAMLAIVLSLAALTPRVTFWNMRPGEYDAYYETTRVPSVLAQLADPGNWDRAYWTNPQFGDNALRWRLLPPVVGHLLRLPARIYLAMPWVGLVLLVGACVSYAGGPASSFATRCAVGVLAATSSAFFGSSCCVGYFDPFYLLALVVFTFASSPAVALGACALGPWCDERFLLMLPVCVCVRWARRPSWPTVLWPAMAIAPYCLARLAALAGGDTSVSRQIAMQSAVLGSYWRSWPLGWWYGFRAGWVVVGVGLVAAGRTLGLRSAVTMAVLVVAALGAVSFLAWDTTRSIAMFLPFLVLGAGVPRVRVWLPPLAAFNLFLPAAFVVGAHPVAVPVTSFLTRL